MEDWVSIKNLKTKNPNLGTRKIAELLGVSRNTVKKALASEAAPQYKSTKSAINKHVLPFEGVIKESFLTKKLKASRILKDIISKGYIGSQYALYAYIRNELKPIQEEVSRNKPFEEWADVFGDEVVASAILDRLLHHSYPFLINGPSYRMKELFKKRKQNEQRNEHGKNSTQIYVIILLYFGWVKSFQKKHHFIPL